MRYTKLRAGRARPQTYDLNWSYKSTRSPTYDSHVCHKLWAAPAYPLAKSHARHTYSRTALFKFNRAQVRNTTPSPRPLFAALHETFREALATLAWHLPSWADVCTAEALPEPFESPAKRQRT